MTAEPVVDQLRFTVEQFERMGETAILDPDTRYELLDGVITVVSPTGPGHAGTVNRIDAFFQHRLFGRATMAVQNPVRLGRRSEPQPDIVIARFRRDYYSSAHPTAEDSHFVIEVSDSTLRTDRMIKLPLYSRQDIPEVWIVNLQDEVVEVYTRSTGDGYAELRTFSGTDKFSPGAFPDLVIEARDLLGDG